MMIDGWSGEVAVYMEVRRLSIDMLIDYCLYSDWRFHISSLRLNIYLMSCTKTMVVNQLKIN